VALAGYASGTWILVLAVLGLGAAVARSGLLYRATLLALTHLPATHVVQGLTLTALGLVFTPAMPNATARVAMAAPLTAEMADALGYAPGSRGRAGMALATLYGFGLSAGMFLTGSTTGLLVQGVLPPEVRAHFTWGTWFLAALPLHLVILGVGLLAALWAYRPHSPQMLARERLALQWKLLGPPSRAERITLAIFLLVLGGFVTQGLHHVDPAWVGLAGLCALLATGALDQATFRSGINWSFLLYLGVLVGLGDVFVHLGLDTWLASHLAVVLAPVAGSPMQFALALTLASFALAFVVRWQAAAVLLTLVLAPAAVALGINPWVVGIIALVATNTWFLPYQSTIYLALYYGMNESYAHASLRPIAWAYALAVLVGVALSVPYWRALGLLG
jgi:anion transporter